MLNQQMIYDVMYALAARGGREQALFGNCAPLARAAFAKSSPCDAFPEIWFELPLAGEPWFDLHVLTARNTLQPDMSFASENTAGYPELFTWFASEEGVRQLAMSFDLRSGGIDCPAAQLLVSDVSQHEPFLRLAGGENAAAVFRSFAQRLPEGWFPCYTGIFPGRAGSAVRVECIPRFELQEAYAQDAALLESHLRQTGFEHFGETLIPRCQALARTPFHLEFQFDILADGSIGGTLGASVRFEAPKSPDEWAFSPGNLTAIGALMQQVQRWGLADDRWQLLPNTIYAKRIERAGEGVTAYCYPAFIKLRWRAGEPLDAKTYLIANAS